MTEFLMVLFIGAMFWLGYCLYLVADALQKKYIPTAQNEEPLHSNEPEPRRGR